MLGRNGRRCRHYWTWVRIAHRERDVPLAWKGDAIRFDLTIQYFLMDHFILRHSAMIAVGLDCRGDNDYLTATRQ
jgi:hypothetical protein